MTSKKQDTNMETFTMIMEKPLVKSIERDIEKISEIKIDKHLYGKLAIVTGIISFIPIMYQIWKTKNTSNFTHKNLLLALFSSCLSALSTLQVS